MILSTMLNTCLVAAPTLMTYSRRTFIAMTRSHENISATIPFYQ